MRARYPDWWPMLEIHARIIPLRNAPGYACRRCGRQFVGRIVSRNRINVGWLQSAARRHAALCDEIHQIAERLDITPYDARKIRARWCRQQLAEQKRAKEERRIRIELALDATAE